jgi:ElaB/YqjD/DUF883 family membrane-anchored ribosome-binding protein
MVDVVKTAQDAANTVNQTAQTVETKVEVSESWVKQHPLITLAIGAGLVLLVLALVL